MHKEVVNHQPAASCSSTSNARAIPTQNIKIHLAAKINLSSSTRILLASSLAATITYITTSQLTQSSWIILITGTLIFLATYTVAAPLTGAINKTDTQNLQETLEGFGPLSYILKIPLNLIEKIIIIFQKS